MSSPDRYRGRPLVRLLECYVLSVIGELSAIDESALSARASSLGRVFGRTGTWQEIIAGEMDLRDQMPTLIMEMWLRNQEIGRRERIALSPQQFAEMFVDENLIH